MANNTKNGSMLFVPSVLWDDYQNGETLEGFNFCPIAKQFGLPKQARLVTHMPLEVGYASPSISTLGDMSLRFSAAEIRYASNTVLRRRKELHTVTFENEEEIISAIRDINLKKNELAVPFSFEYIKEFNVVIKDKGITVTYRRSNITPSIVEADVSSKSARIVNEVIPYLDCAITYKNGDTRFFSLGLNSLLPRKLYEIAAFWFEDLSDKDEKRLIYYAGIYLTVQEMIDVAPIHVVVSNSSNQPIEISAIKKSFVARKTKLWRTRTKGKRKKSGEDRPAGYDCQAVRGYKTANGTEVEGYYRGPERNNPEFQAKCKHNYVPVLEKE